MEESVLRNSDPNNSVVGRISTGSRLVLRFPLLKVITSTRMCEHQAEVYLVTVCLFFLFIIFTCKHSVA